MNTNAFIYMRVSTREQAEGDGFPRQLEKCEKFCAEKGFSVLRRFQEQESGSHEFADRDAMSEMMDLCGPATSKIVVVERADRVARDLIVQELFLKACKEKGILVYCADSGEEIVQAAGDPTRKLIRQILGAVSEWDKAQIVLKLQAGRRRKKRETGKPCGGPPPYGQTDSEKAVVAEVVHLRKKGFTFDRICFMLKEKGFPPQKGGYRWYRTCVKNIYDRATSDK